jgi:hypothetical protein
MDISINYWAVLVCGVVALIVGSVWFGPIFGKLWMRITHTTDMDEARRKEMQKAAMPLYVIQFVLALFQAYVLAHYIAGWTEATGVENALWIWAAFVMPTVAGTAMWNNDSNKIKWTKFWLQSGYYLVLLVIFGWILSAWR